LSKQECEKLLAEGRKRRGLTAKVRERLQRRIAEMPDMDELANELHLTPRTLRRRLLEEGTTFRSLREEVRMTLAEKLLLAESHLSLQQIAEQLGYSDASSFVSAFKRYCGRTPGNLRVQADIDRNGS
jgi:AraC-like DNA-binding protein